MTNEVVVGIDIGTSYIKGLAQTIDGLVLSTYRKKSTQNLAYLNSYLTPATSWWSDVKDVFLGLLQNNKLGKTEVKSICVSAIAPTLTLFDASNSGKAYSILYSALSKSEKLNPTSVSDLQLTKNRVHYLKQFAYENQFVTPCITDLVGYINWCLSKKLTINVISLSEMGLTNSLDNCEILRTSNEIIPQPVAVCEIIGVTHKTCEFDLGVKRGIPICGGCPDTLNSAIGAGLLHSQNKMLYLGTFGTLLELKTDINLILDTVNINSKPYECLLSFPFFGPKIESLSNLWFGSDNLNLFDKAVSNTSIGANGVLFLLPRWKKGMTTVGNFEFIANRSGDLGDISIRSRAALEGIAYAVFDKFNNSDSLNYVSGGGARSQVWMNTISSILGKNLSVKHMSWEPVGSADIAARMFNKNISDSHSYQLFTPQQKINFELIKDNYYRIKKYYNERNWL
jgi:sugar (pentulose or hexulose) kinase